MQKEGRMEREEEKMSERRKRKRGETEGEIYYLLIYYQPISFI